MALYVSSKPTSTPAPAGGHVARCYHVLDIGTHTNGGKFPKTARRVTLRFELPHELHVFKEGDPAKPFSVTQTFTHSLHEKAALRKFLQGWRGKAFSEEELKKFDLATLLGKPVFLNIIHETSDGTTYANIASASMLPRGMDCPPAVNEPLTLSLEQEDFDPKVFAKLTEKQQEKIAASPEYQALGLDGNIPRGTQGPDDGDYSTDGSDVPF